MFELRLVMVVLACTLGCKSSKLVPIKQRASIAVPAGLNANDVEVAVLYELADQQVPADRAPGERIANSSRFLFLYRSGPTPKAPSWYPESVEQGLVYAGFEKGQHYLRVAMEYTDSVVQIRLIESRNLLQIDQRIHRNAIAWIDQLQVRIRRALGQMATIRALGGREPK